jgi:hypothetical protein
MHSGSSLSNFRIWFLCAYQDKKESFTFDIYNHRQTPPDERLGTKNVYLNQLFGKRNPFPIEAMMQ